MPRSLLGAAAVVVLTWWAILTTGALAQADGYTPLFEATFQTLAVVFIGCLAGVLAVTLWIEIDRRERRSALAQHDMRGLLSSIGPVPMLLQAPAEAPTLPRFQAPDVPDDFYVRWLHHFDRTHPRHTALMRRMMRIMQQHRHLPASPVPGGHGDRTLLQHSLLCGYLMHDLARDFRYEGARSKNTAKLVLPLVDPNYKFDAADPLCVIIGIAHDLGKIESYRYDESGRVVDIGDEHDLTGARMVARLEECWDLPDKDRFAMMMALAHYHHPQELPLSPDRKAIDDRTIALMELLMLADIQASAIENSGRRMTSDELAQRSADADNTQQLDAQEIYRVFVDLMHQTERINSRESDRCIAWYAQVRGSNRPLFVINEGNMAAAIASVLDIDGTPELPDRRRVLTVALLGELARKGALISKAKIGNGQIAAYNPQSALWKARFNQRHADGQQSYHFGPVVVFLIDPATLPDSVGKVKQRAGDVLIDAGVFGQSRLITEKPAAEKSSPQDVESSPHAAPASPPWTSASASTPSAEPEGYLSPNAAMPSRAAADVAKAVDTGNPARPPEKNPQPVASPAQDVGKPLGLEKQDLDVKQLAREIDAGLDGSGQPGPADDQDTDSFTVGVDPVRVTRQHRSDMTGKQAHKPFRPMGPSQAVHTSGQRPGNQANDRRSSPMSASVPEDGGIISASAGERPSAAASPLAAQPKATTRVAANIEAQDVMAGLIGTINALGPAISAYVTSKEGKPFVTLPIALLVKHWPSVQWIEARSAILALAHAESLPIQPVVHAASAGHAFEIDLSSSIIPQSEQTPQPSEKATT